MREVHRVDVEGVPHFRIWHTVSDCYATEPMTREQVAENIEEWRGWKTGFELSWLDTAEVCDEWSEEADLDPYPTWGMTHEELMAHYNERTTAAIAKIAASRNAFEAKS